MDVVFCGRFENAFMAGCQEPDNLREGGHSYYDGLLRPVPRGLFERCGTFIAIANHTRVPGVDWTPNMMRKSSLDESLLGYEPSPNYAIVSEVESFAAGLLISGAFSSSARAALEIHPWPDHYRPKDRKLTRTVEGIGELPEFELAQLVRILAQIDLAGETGASLVLGDLEQNILKEMTDFVVANNLDSPIEIPDFCSKTIIDAEKFATGLLNYSPPDIDAIAAVRSDKAVQRYASQIRDVLAHPSCIDTQRDLVRAMREQRDESGRIRGAQKVFEIISFVLAPLPLGIVKLFPAAMAWGLKGERRKRSWNVMASRMADIAVDDYLRRTGNL